MEHANLEVAIFSLFVKLFACLFLASLGLCCCMWTFSSCSEWRLLCIAVYGFLTVEASLVEDRLWV